MSSGMSVEFIVCGRRHRTHLSSYWLTTGLMETANTSGIHRNCFLHPGKCSRFLSLCTDSSQLCTVVLTQCLNTGFSSYIHKFLLLSFSLSLFLLFGLLHHFPHCHLLLTQHFSSLDFISSLQFSVGTRGFTSSNMDVWGLTEWSGETETTSTPIFRAGKGNL